MQIASSRAQRVAGMVNITYFGLAGYVKAYSGLQLKFQP
jgi:hypothetical protein